MFKKIAKWVIVASGAAIGFALGYNISLIKGFAEMLNIAQPLLTVGLAAITGMIFGLIFYLLSNFIIRVGVRITESVELELTKMPVGQLLTASVGLIIGLVIAYLVSGLFSTLPIPYVPTVLSIATYVFLGYLGISLSMRNTNDLSRLPDILKRTTGDMKNDASMAKPKILDTSVIIDGRIADICKTGFIEGEIIIPEFVLEELRHIADSSDSLKRNRGRRGLDILKLIQKDMPIEVRIVDNDFEEVHEVDIKLLKLAQAINGTVVTNDYNLNKVAALQDVPILNINELANAVKPVVLPGEEMTVQIIKEGKENNQGIAYLDDGTMIVVEGGKKHINKTKDVVVTSVLQTAAGRMIFAKPI